MSASPPFDSSLADDLEAYIALKRALGRNVVYLLS